MIDPPVPPDADLRHFANMPIDVVALVNSDLAATGDPADNWYAFKLWCAAWHQVPAGSLPNDDAQLAYLAGIGRNRRLWIKHRTGALHGFEIARDGRFYHSKLSRVVIETLTKSRRLSHNAKSRWDRERSQDPDNAADPPSKSTATPQRGAMPGIEGNRGEEVKEDSPDGESKKSRRGSRLPDDFQPDSDWAIAKGYPAEGIPALIAEFRDYWRSQSGQRGVKADWPATWRNRVRQKLEIRGPPNGAGEIDYRKRTSDYLKSMDDPACLFPMAALPRPKSIPS